MENKRGRFFKVAWMVLGAVILLLPLISVAGEQAPAPLPRVHWRFHSIMPPGHYLIKPAEEAFDKLSAFTGGRFKVTIYPTGGMGFTSRAIWDAIGKGLVDIGEMWPTHVSGKYPFATVLDLPGLYNHADVKLTERLSDELWDDLTKRFLEDNLYALGMFSLGVAQGLSVNKPLNLTEPKRILKGLKIRVAGPPSAWAIEVLGGTPVYIDWGEIYLAAQRGVVDGIDLPPGSTMINMKWFEVVKWGVFADLRNWWPLELVPCSCFWVVNKGQFEALPVEWQKKLKELMREAQYKANIEHVKLVAEGAKTCIEKYGMVTVQVPPETEAYLKEEAGKYQEQWKAKAGSLGNQLLNKALVVIKK